MHLKAQSYGMPSESVDGMDVRAVERAVREAAAAARGDGPRFVELRTYRFRAHSMFDPELYRDKAEVELWKERDPIARFKAELGHAGQLDETTATVLETEVAAEIAAAVSFAELGTWEPVEDLTKDVTTPWPA